MGSDTNLNDYAAGSYTYLQTGPTTALLTNMEIGMLSALGTTNVSTLNLMFTSVTSANYAWTNESSSGSGTMTFVHVSPLAPATLAGKTLSVIGGKQRRDYLRQRRNVRENHGGHSNGSGTYTFTPYSPTVGIVEMTYTDANNQGVIDFFEMTFTSLTNVKGLRSHL